MGRSASPPAEFFKKSLLGTARLIAQALALWWLPAAAMLLLWNEPSLGVLLRAALALPLLFLSAHGLHAVGLVGHDGTHFNLHPDRLASARIGVLISSLVPG